MTVFEGFAGSADKGRGQGMWGGLYEVKEAMKKILHYSL